MDFKAASGRADELKSGCIVVTILGKNQLSPSAEKIDVASKGHIKSVLKSGDLSDGKSLLLHSVPGIKAERVLLVHVKGTLKKLSIKAFKDAISTAAKSLKTTASKNAALFFSELTVEDKDAAWKAKQQLLICRDNAYQYPERPSKAPALKTLQIVVTDKRQLTSTRNSIKTATAIANGVDVAKTLGNLPGNICTPTYLAKQARAMAKGVGKLSVKILEEAEMKRLGMGVLLSVSQGSKQPAKLIIMNYQGAKKTEKPQVLVGKGITFDAGGISLKPGPGMDEMKFDMCGAASVFGTMQAIKELQPAMNVIAIVAASENLPSSTATKPGDVFTSMSGQTVEILNTDAEGRLVLCDALTYAERFKPKAVIDVATLTGACVIALGKIPSALYSNSDKLAKAIQTAGENSGDRVWQMPLWDEYQSELDSNFADMANIGSRYGGSITAACFLSRFAKQFDWAHLDIAGTAWKSGAEKGATGRPVPLLTEYLLSQC